MGTMSKPDKFDPKLYRIPGDEPIFILRGQDATAPTFVEAWADSAERYGVNPEKVAAARACAAKMRAWRNRKTPD